MMDYSKLVKALRCELHGVPCHDENCEWLWHGGGCCDEVRMMVDAAAAIEALQAEQKKTVTQIFGEEQMAWEGRCKDLMKHISDLQAEIRESMQKCAECGDAQEQKVKGLQAEVERLKDSNEELREKQTYADHYGDKWRTSGKDIVQAAYDHGYMDGWDEPRAKMEVQE